MAAVLVGLNAASYTQKQKTPDSEMMPNRSSYNSGPTGTQAFYTLLAETGRKVVRWQEPADALATKGKNAPSVFVVIGSVRRDFKEPEYTALLKWVSSGGRLVIIDREPPDNLITTTANWKIGFKQQNQLKLFETDTSDAKQMTADTPAAKPAQPSLFTQGVNAVQTSRFAASITFDHFIGDNPPPGLLTSSAPPPPPRPAPRMATPTPDPDDDEDNFDPSPGTPSNVPPANFELKKTGPNSNKTGIVTVATPTPKPITQLKIDKPVDSPSQYAPVAHIASDGRNILVDAPFGSGRIVYLSDPYVVSNGGIELVDNAQLAINIVSTAVGTIAFDEYHQGFGGENNRFFEFFAGTPVVAIFFQCALLVGLIFFSQSRRFGRALPDTEPDRLSKLEYVSAMAELQQRTKAFDLAIENIYRDFRRRTARLVGVDNMSVSRTEFAARIAERSKADPNAVEDLLFKCDEIIIGEPTNKREVLSLVTRIREIEFALGLRKRPGK